MPRVPGLGAASGVLFLGPLRALFGGRAKGYGDVTPREAKQLVETEDAVLVDVRESAEWRAGHAPRARHVPLRSLGAHLDKLPRDRPVIVVCASGMRSRSAARTLADAGFSRVLNVKGGMTAWRSSGLPVSR